MNEIRTFHEMLDSIVSSYNEISALNIRKAGSWRSHSTQAVYKQARHFALGLDAIGVTKGQTVGIMGRPSPDWMITDLAVMSIGAVTVPIFPEEPETTRRYKISDASIEFMVLLDDESLSEFAPHAGEVSTVISIPASHGFTSYASVVGRGERINKKEQGRFAQLGARINPHDLSTIYYTSGSTGTPKGVELTHSNIMSQIRAASVRIPLFHTDRALSCLPLAHSFERFMVHYYLASGVPVYFNSDIHELGRDLQHVKPTVTAVVPRILSKFYEKFHEKIATSSAIKRQIGMMAIDWAFAREPGTGSIDWRGMTADALVFKKLRRALGGGMRVMITGGAAMPPDLYRFFVNAGVPVCQGYGMTETSPVLSVNSPSAHKIGTVGLPFPGVHIKISDEGEILAKGANVMRGYHNLPDETEKMIDKDHWIHTGDLGVIDDEGYLAITGRKKELMKTSSGEYIAPTAIEHKICSSPLVDMALIVAEGRPFASSVLFAPEASSEEQLALIDQHMITVNESLEHWEQIREYRVSSDLLSAETGELTPTMKIRRHVVLEKYKNLIDEMYNQPMSSSAHEVRRAS